MLLLHCLRIDGSVFHVEFCSETIELSMEDEEVLDSYAHGDDVPCGINPTGLGLARYKRAGGALNKKQESIVKLTMAGITIPPESSFKAPDQPGVFQVLDSRTWPPETELTVDQLIEFSGLAKIDAIALLRAPWKKLEQKPRADVRGQLLLF